MSAVGPKALKKRRSSSVQETVPNKKARIDVESLAEILIKEFCSVVGVNFTELPLHQRLNIGAFLDTYVDNSKTSISSLEVDPAPREFRVQSIVDKQVRRFVPILSY